MKCIVLLFCALSVAIATDSNVRLVDKDGNVNTQRGRVEVYLDEKWGQVCGEDFSSLDATVACRSVGSGSGSVETGQHGVGSSPVVIGGVKCTGSEGTILDCTYKYVYKDLP